MSFFDEGDEPTRVSRPRPRRPSGAARPRSGGSRPPGAGGGGRAPADQQLLVRRAVAAGIFLLLFLLLAFAIRACAENRQESALKDYNRDVSAIVADSDQSVGRPFFDLMARAGREGSELSVQVNELRKAADEQAGQARRLDAPDEMRPAQDAFELAMNLRSGALRQIARLSTPALGRGPAAEEAIEQIAGQMRSFDASDVVYQLRVAPLIRQALDDEEIGGQRIAGTQFLPDISWLDPETVADAYGGSLSGGDDDASGEPAPGLHGHGLTSTSIGGTALQPGQTNRVAAGSGLAFTVVFANQGDNDEQDVRVTVTIRGSGRPIALNRTVDQTQAGSEAEVSVPLDRAPPVGEAVTVEAAVRPVPGEGKTDNNSQRYTVIFTR